MIVHLFSDKEEAIADHGYCSYKALYMDRKQKCPYSEYIKIYFKSTGHPVSTGFFGYFHVISKGRSLSFAKGFFC